MLSGKSYQNCDVGRAKEKMLADFPEFFLSDKES